MKSTSVWGNIKKDWWVVIGSLVLVLAIVIGLVLVAYFWTRNEPSGSTAIEPFDNSLKYPFNWVVTDTNTYTDTNNGVKHTAIFKKNGDPANLENTNVTSVNSVPDSDKVIGGTISIDASNPIINLNSANEEFIQILPTNPDTSADYGFVRPTTVGAGFTIAMWVKFPATRTFNAAGQSECLVEIFKNQKDGKDGAWKSAGTNWGAYFHIVRRTNNYSSVPQNDNNKIVTGFVGKSVVGPKIDDTKWHHIAVSVKSTSIKQSSQPKNFASTYEFTLYVDGVGYKETFQASELDQIFMGAEAEFNIGKFTRGISNGKQYGYANMSFTGLQLHNRVLEYYEVMELVPLYINYVSSSIVLPSTETITRFVSAYVMINTNPYLLFTIGESTNKSMHIKLANDTFNKKNIKYLKDFGIIKTADTPNVYVFALENNNTFGKPSGHVDFKINNATFSSANNCIATIKQSELISGNSFDINKIFPLGADSKDIYSTLSYGLTNYPIQNTEQLNKDITNVEKYKIPFNFIVPDLNLNYLQLLSNIKKVQPQIPFQSFQSIQSNTNTTSYLLFKNNYITKTTGNSYTRFWTDNNTGGHDHSIWINNTTGYIYGNISNNNYYTDIQTRNSKGYLVSNNTVNKNFTDFMSLTFSDDKTEKLDATTGFVNLYFMDISNNKFYISLTANQPTVTNTPSLATQFTEYVCPENKKLSKYTTKINSNTYILGFDYINGDTTNTTNYLKLYIQDTANSSLDYSSYDSIIPIQFDTNTINSMNSSNQIHNNKRPWYIFDNSNINSTFLHGKGNFTGITRKLKDDRITYSNITDGTAIKLIAKKYTTPTTTKPSTTQSTTTTTTTKPSTTQSTTTTTRPTTTTTTRPTTTTTTVPTTTTTVPTTTTTEPTTTTTERTTTTTTTTTTEPTTTTTTTTRPTTTTTTTIPTTTTTIPTTTTTTTVPTSTRATNVYGTNQDAGSHITVHIH